MIPLKDLRQQILTYNDTGDNSLFYEILYNVDYLILFFIKKLRRRLPYIRRLEFTEIYHTSIIALHRAVSTWPRDMDEKYIPCRLRAYMIAEFQKCYAYLDKDYELDSNEYYKTLKPSKIDLNDIDYRSTIDSLEDKEAEALDNYMKKIETMTHMAKKENITLDGMSKRINKTIKRLKAKNESKQ